MSNTIVTIMATKNLENVSVKDYGAVGDGTDATVAFQNAVNAAAIVRIPPGTYLINSLIIPSNTEIMGSGQGLTILKQVTGANDLCHTAAGSSNTVDGNTRNVSLADLTLQGTVNSDGFQEVLHLMFLQGASDIRISNVLFSGFRGDGIYIGTGNERGQNPSQERHNERVHITSCKFDGETKNNRNGISIVDCDGAWIEDCYFTRCSKLDMPGCIDIEPDSGGTPSGSLAIIRNINIIGNKFYDNAGAGVISLNFPNPQSVMNTPVSGINIVRNYIDKGAYDHTVGISVNCSNSSESDIPRQLVVRDNTIHNMSSPFLVQGVRGIQFSGNEFSISRYSGQIGAADGSRACFDIDFERNRFHMIASDNTSGGNAIFLYAGKRLSFRWNIFDSCGKQNNSYNANLVLATGSHVDITISENIFYSPVVNVSSWDVRNDSGTLAQGTFKHTGNKLVNVAGGTSNCAHNNLQAHDYAMPVLQNSWVSYGGKHQIPQYWKDETGTVNLRGTLKGGTTVNGNSVLSLPVGFRPGKILPFLVYTSGGVGSVQIENTIGDMQVLNLPTNAMVSLNGIQFKAEG